MYSYGFSVVYFKIYWYFLDKELKGLKYNKKYFKL